ncbi:acyltransferase family protein [Myceligenerans crystallogenes]|uniref:Acyltransferase family protein n=1 Tax=Myceligenerans crystallogenes TaxID=316335 RepID=A0ABN2NCP1_9MICO
MTSPPTLSEPLSAPGASLPAPSGLAGLDPSPFPQPVPDTGAGRRPRGDAGARGDRGGFRPELQGLRAVAVLLVVAYHVWFGRVSGGVDVFLFLTGFLITGSLVRMVERTGRVRPFTFLARLAARLLPPVAIVLAATVAAAFYLMPRGRLLETIDQALASLTYHENWHLALRAVDYNSRDEGSSLLQHFWSLSIQGQFYLVWLVVVAVGLLVATVFRRRSRPVRVRGPVLVLMLLVGAASLYYSVELTATNQVWAYFDTGARLWEFAVGGVLALTIDRFRLPRWFRVVLGWSGLLALVSLGALVDVSTLFPGYIALWPVLAAALVLVAGHTRVPGAVDGLLASRPFAVLADWSYALYLWHWPVLVLYLNHRGVSSADALGGAVVVAISLALAGLTTALLKVPGLRVPRKARRSFTHFAYALVWVVPALAGGLYLQQQVAIADQRAAEREAFLASDAGRYPGAGALVDPELHRDMPQLPWIPAILPQDDLPAVANGECLLRPAGPGLEVCESGDPAGDRTIALVGSSRAEHYYDAFDAAAARNGWRMVTLTRHGCQYAADAGGSAPDRATSGPASSSGSSADPEEAGCADWNKAAHRYLTADPPDLVITLGSRRLVDQETYPDGFAARWDDLTGAGSRILALEDIPRLPSNMLECAQLRGPGLCDRPAPGLRGSSTIASHYPDLPSGVTFRSFVPLICPKETCSAVQGNVLVYRDASHLTATYAATLAPVAERFVRDATGW